MDGPENQPDTAAGEDPTPAARSRLRAVPRVLRRPLARRAGSALAILAVAVAGVALGLLLAGRVDADIGPFRAELSVGPSLTGDTKVNIPPLGSLALDTHQGPSQLTVELGELDQGRVEALIDDPTGITRATQSVVGDIQRGLMRLGFRAAAVSMLAAMILAALIYRRARPVAASGLTALALVLGSLGVGALTIRPQSIEEPRYEGLLVNAPALIGDVQKIASDYNKYAEQLQRLVGNVSRIYATVSTLPVYEPQEGTTRILHVSDLHLNPAAWPVIRTIVEQYRIDAVIDTGDITDWGSEPEASYVASIGLLDVPYVYIRGNHDSSPTQAAVAGQQNAVVLDNQIADVAGLTVAGIGDPRFTPDKETAGRETTEEEQARLAATGARLDATIEAGGRPVQIALVHDPKMAGPLAGDVPVVLAGHTHNREVRELEPGAPTLLMTQGSSGGAGLRGLESEEPVPLALSVLYFDETKSLQAYDDIRVGGTGQSQVTLERHLIGDTIAARPTPAAEPSGPTPAEPSQPSPAVPPSPTRAEPSPPVPAGPSPTGS
ncbi:MULTISPECIES: metallophosphoesterase family protein [Catenuloplanes]|uniref:MPP superfamily phosphohydrolase n=1 Tax=Catenuloplanes niger TaxID=587534 RepID=A0AAE4CT10_9ACTN|nr:metallophosphoesterase [Catenuloplanes niger]MDR7324776.1 putative MPP superfamily phosphohydrolase [Catenuloplanes niger]